MIFAICSVAVILALTIIVMASCIKVASDEFNWMEQKYYARLKELDLKKRRMKMTDGVRETSCTNCLYHEVCKHKEDYLKVCENVFKSATKESFEFLGDVFISCRFYKTAAIIENHGEWDYWPGWRSNNDSRLEDATFPFCGYKHPVIMWDRQAPRKLPRQCPNCNAFLDIHEEDK